MRAPGISLFLFSPQAVPVARLARAMRGARSLWRVRPEPRVRSAGHGPRVTARAARHLLCAESSGQEPMARGCSLSHPEHGGSPVFVLRVQGGTAVVLLNETGKIGP